MLDLEKKIYCLDDCQSTKGAMIYISHYYTVKTKFYNFIVGKKLTPFQGGASFMDHLCYFCLVLLCFRARLFIDALWSPAGKGLTCWISFVMYNCEVVTFSLVS